MVSVLRMERRAPRPVRYQERLGCEIDITREIAEGESVDRGGGGAVHTKKGVVFRPAHGLQWLHDLRGVASLRLCLGCQNKPPVVGHAQGCKEPDRGCRGRDGGKGGSVGWLTLRELLDGV